MWTLRRRAARVVVLDPDQRVLLLRTSDPARPARGKWWEIPGGGIDGSEAAGDAAARELYEETGITDAAMGPCVWVQHAAYTFAGMHFDSAEQIFVATVPVSAPAPDIDYQPGGLEALEAVAFSGARWWPVADLAGLVAAGERMNPPWLARQLPAVLAAGAWPAEPIDMGEVGDVFAAEA